MKSAEVRAEVEGDGGSPFAHQFDIGKIIEAQQALLDDVGGPNEGIESKLEQLRMHERIHQLYVDQELTRKNLFSHYLHCTAIPRKRWIAQLEAILEAQRNGNGDVQIVFLQTRLGKIPPGWYILADRGFSGCAPSYPYLNAQLTPFFLDGRDQFDAEEISVDRTKCKLRYGSETKFSQVTDWTALKDRIPRAFFRYLHHICDFAHGMSNYCEPFYLPYDENNLGDDYFADLREERERKRKADAEKKEAKKRRLRRNSTASAANAATDDDGIDTMDEEE